MPNSETHEWGARKRTEARDTNFVATCFTGHEQLHVCNRVMQRKGAYINVSGQGGCGAAAASPVAARIAPHEALRLSQNIRLVAPSLALHNGRRRAQRRLYTARWTALLA